MRFYCLGCDQIKIDLGFLTDKICSDCCHELQTTTPIYTNIVSKDNLWFGKILAVGPYSGIYRNLLYHAKVNRNPCAAKTIEYWVDKKLSLIFKNHRLTKQTSIKQSFWSVLTLRVNIAAMMQQKLCSKKTVTIQDPRQRNFYKRSFAKKGRHLIFRDQVAWSTLNTAEHVVFDDVISTGKTIDDTICSLRDFSPKLIVAWACHPKFLRPHATPQVTPRGNMIYR